MESFRQGRLVIGCLTGIAGWQGGGYSILELWQHGPHVLPFWLKGYVGEFHMTGMVENQRILHLDYIPYYLFEGK